MLLSERRDGSLGRIFKNTLVSGEERPSESQAVTTERCGARGLIEQKQIQPGRPRDAPDTKQSSGRAWRALDPAPTLGLSRLG